MTNYVLNVCYPADATPPSPDELERIMRDVSDLRAALRDEGAWVFGGGLHDPSLATVITSSDGAVAVMDGPFVETKEVIGGLSIIDVADLDTALRWAGRMAAATTCPIEVRPFVDSAS